jgi:hypothetical protein
MSVPPRPSEFTEAVGHLPLFVVPQNFKIPLSQMVACAFSKNDAKRNNHKVIVDENCDVMSSGGLSKCGQYAQKRMTTDFQFSEIDRILLRSIK